MGAAGAALVVLGISAVRGGHFLTAGAAVLAGLVLLQAIPGYLYSTYRGKFIVWAELVDDLHLRGDERVLDIGCGRGAVLAIAAKRIPRGRATGIDLWRAGDQSGNSPAAAQRNLENEGVRTRCALVTADAVAMPFRTGSFDIVVSSLAVHNIARPEDRLRALDEAIRVLKPGGRLVLADLMHTRSYARHLRDRGMRAVTRRPLSWRLSYGVGGLATRLVTATAAVGSDLKQDH